MPQILRHAHPKESASHKQNSTEDHAPSTDIVSHDTVTTCGPKNGGTNCSDGSAPGYYVTITGSLSYTPVMPYSILASPTTLSDQAVVRIQ